MTSLDLQHINTKRISDPKQNSSNQNLHQQASDIVRAIKHHRD